MSATPRAAASRGSSSPATRCWSATSPGPTSRSRRGRRRATCTHGGPDRRARRRASRSGPATSAARSAAAPASAAKPARRSGTSGRHNPLLAVGEAEFVERLTANLLPKPPNGGRIVDLNRADEASAPGPVEVLDSAALAAALARGAQVLDGRSPGAFDRAHLSGAIWLPPGNAQGTRAGWVVDPDDELVIVGADLDDARRVALAMQAVGLWNIAGLTASGPDDWAAADLPVSRGTQWDLDALAAGLDGATEITLIDVRDGDEWDGGHVPGSLSLPLHRLTAEAATITPSGPIAVACAGGVRAAFAASVLRRELPTAKIVRIADGGVPGLATRGITLTTPTP